MVAVAWGFIREFITQFKKEHNNVKGRKNISTKHDGGRG